MVPNSYLPNKKKIAVSILFFSNLHLDLKVFRLLCFSKYDLLLPVKFPYCVITQHRNESNEITFTNQTTLETLFSDCFRAKSYYLLHPMCMLIMSRDVAVALPSFASDI